MSATDPPSSTPDPRHRATAASRPDTRPAHAGVAEILRLLREVYGEMPWRPHGDPISELILTILSQHTADTNSGRAFANLISAYPDWDAVRAAAAAGIAEATRAAGLSTTKAPRIKQVLQQIRDERGGYDLGFLRELPLDAARAWLMALPGVGPKTAACVLLFALGMPALPVDTHVFRVATRLGLLPAKATADAAHGILEAIVAPEQVYRFHVGLIKHGRHVCRAQRPLCGACVLNGVCPSSLAAKRLT